MKDMLKKVFKHWEMFLVIFLILEFVVFGAANPKFLRPQSIMNSIVNYISVCIISLFVTMVMITGGIDIQAPAIIGLSSIIIGVLWSDAGLNIWAAVAIAMVVAALCGALSGFFVAYCGKDDVSFKVLDVLGNHFHDTHDVGVAGLHVEDTSSEHVFAGGHIIFYFLS